MSSVPGVRDPSGRARRTAVRRPEAAAGHSAGPRERPRRPAAGRGDFGTGQRERGHGAGGAGGRHAGAHHRRRGAPSLHHSQRGRHLRTGRELYYTKILSVQGLLKLVSRLP